MEMISRGRDGEVDALEDLERAEALMYMGSLDDHRLVGSVVGVMLDMLDDVGRQMTAEERGI